MATHETAITQYIVANGIRLAHRRLGRSEGILLVMMNPDLMNALAKSRPILLLDNAGTGKSEGEIPTTFQGWAAHAIGLIEALNI